jgi:hypothetical protein
MTPERTLKLILRWIGTASLLGVIFVFVPYESMDSIHRALGMGALPAEPVVGYLTRSLSAFYALMGGLFWFVSLDPRRHRDVLGYLGAAVATFGALLLGIDLAEGMPPFWTWWEGPFVVVMGSTIFALGRRLGADERA